MKGKELIELLKPFEETELEFLPIENGRKIEILVNEGEDCIATIDCVKNEI